MNRRLQGHVVSSTRLARVAKLTLGLLLLAWLEPAAFAATKTWSGGDGNDSNWTSNGNWSGVLAPGADDDLVFSDALLRRTNVNNFTINTNFSSLNFSGSNWSISGNAIFLGANGTTGGITASVPSNNPTVFSPNILLGKNQAFNATSGTQFPYTLNGVVNLQTHTLTLGGIGAHVLNGAIIGTGALVKSGTGAVFLNAASNLFGASTINAGTFNIGTAASLGAVTLAGGTLRVDGAAGAITLQGGTLTGNGPVGNVTSSGAAAKTIAPAGVVGTPTAIMVAGTTILSPSTTLAIDLNGTTPGSQHDQLDTTSINLSGANLSLSLGFLPSNGSAFTIVTGGGASSVSGQFAQGTSITTVGGTVFSITYNSNSVVVTRQPSTGTWSGAGADNNWTTGANWVGGIAPVAGDNLVFPAGASRGTNNNNYTAGTNFKSINLNGTGYVIGGNAILLSNGISESVVTYPVGPDVRPRFNLPVTLTAAQNFIANDNGFVLGGTVNLNGFALILAGPVIENLTRPSPALTGTIIGAGGIAKAGVGEFVLTGVNTYTGVTNISAGVLAIQNNFALGATSAGNGTLVAAGATLRITGEGIETPEPITLNGTGTASPDYAALQVSGCHTTPCVISGPITLASNSDVAILPPISGGTVTISGVIGETGGARSLTKANSSGTVILSAVNTYTGGTTVGFGTLLVNGTVGAVALNTGTLGGTGTVGVVSGIGTVAPGASPGILTSGSVTFTAGDTLAVEIGGLTPGTQHDKLNVTGTVNLGGATLQGALVNGFVPAAGNTFTIIQSTGAITGQFAQGSTITFNGVQFNIAYNTNSVVLSIAAALLPDLTVVKTHAGNFSQGQVGAQYSATVTNSGAGDMAASSITLTDTPPAGLTVTAMSGTGWTCTVLPTCTRADALNAFQSYPPVAITVTVAANATSPQLNHIAVTTSATESSTANNGSDDSTTVDLPDLTVTKSHTGNFSQGLTGATYTVTVNNIGAGVKPAAKLVSVVDTAPAGLTVTAMSGSGWTCAVLPTCTRSDALGASQAYPSITVTVTVAPNATSPKINNVAVSTAATESNTGNNSGADSTAIDPRADLIVTSTLDTDGTICGGTCTLRQAINAANLSVGADQIKFAIATGTPPFTISPASPLPTITDAVTIDGYTQAGASANTLADGEDAVILIQVDGSSAGVSVAGLGICAGDTVIRGLSITGFAARGVDIGGTTTLNVCPFIFFTDVTLAGNFVGLLPDGSAGGNLQGGVSEFGFDNTVIGGGVPADRNVISANGKHGLYFSNVAAGRRVDNNYIGTDPGGTLDFGNAEQGLTIETGASGMAVGTIAPNRIAFNATGIAISSTASTGNTVFANDFFSNTNLGIDLGVAGATANDADDADGGGNGGQNFPDLTGFTLGAGSITLNGTLDVPDASNNAQYVIALYQSADCDLPSGFGEGEVYLGSKTVSFTGNGTAAPEPFSAQFNVTPVVGGVFTATATDPNGSTSEFSACLPNGGLPNLLFQNGFE